MFQKDNEQQSEHLTHCWAESISKGFRNVHHLSQEPFPGLNKTNNFEYISRCNFYANQKQKCQTVLLQIQQGALHRFSTSAAVYFIQYGIAGPLRLTSVDLHADVGFAHLGSGISGDCNFGGS